MVPDFRRAGENKCSMKKNLKRWLKSPRKRLKKSLKKKMKKADNRNIMAPNKRPILNSLGKSPILSAAMHKAAKVPGAAAFLIGFIRLSNSSAMQAFSA